VSYRPDGRARVIPVIGVDPGVRGGIALLDGEGKAVSVVGLDPSMTDKEVVDLVTVMACGLRAMGSRTCFMEKVGYMRGDGGKGAFTFGRIVGLLRGALLANEIEIESVYPAVWMAGMNCMTGGNKNVSKNLAQRLFPGLTIGHKEADATLIAVYAQRTMRLRGPQHL
jgi:hypothetical protein